MITDGFTYATLLLFLAGILETHPLTPSPGAIKEVKYCRASCIMIMMTCRFGLFSREYMERRYAANEIINK